MKIDFHFTLPKKWRIISINIHFCLYRLTDIIIAPSLGTGKQTRQGKSGTAGTKSGTGRRLKLRAMNF